MPVPALKDSTEYINHKIKSASDALNLREYR